MTVQIVIHNLLLQTIVVQIVCNILHNLLLSCCRRFVVVHPLIVIFTLLIRTSTTLFITLTLLITRMLLNITLILFQITCVQNWNMIYTIIFNKFVNNCITTILTIVPCAFIQSTTLHTTFMLFQQTFSIRAVPVVRININ
jgi:hypothetical protein